MGEINKPPYEFDPITMYRFSSYVIRHRLKVHGISCDISNEKRGILRHNRYKIKAKSPKQLDTINNILSREFFVVSKILKGLNVLWVEVFAKKVVLIPLGGDFTIPDDYTPVGEVLAPGKQYWISGGEIDSALYVVDFKPTNETLDMWEWARGKGKIPGGKELSIEETQVILSNVLAYQENKS